MRSRPASALRAHLGAFRLEVYRNSVRVGRYELGVGGGYLELWDHRTSAPIFRRLLPG